MPWPSPTRDAVETLIRERGPQTVRELAKALGKPIGVIKSCIKDGRKPGKKRFFIIGYGELAGDGYRRPAKYALGNRKDLPYPNVDRLERYNRYRRKLGKEERKDPHNRTPSVKRPFDSLIEQILKE